MAYFPLPPDIKAYFKKVLCCIGVSGDQIAAGAITTTKIADLAVTTAKLAALGVTTAKLAADAVTNAKLADSSVSIEQLDAGIKPAAIIVASGARTWNTNTAANTFATAATLVAGDLGFATVAVAGGAEVVKSVALNTGTGDATITLSASGTSATTVVNWFITRVAV